MMVAFYCVNISCSHCTCSYISWCSRKYCIIVYRLVWHYCYYIIMDKEGKR